jgi:hypothetical protein
MDNNLLEFWGNVLLTAARGQKQLEEISNMTKNGWWGMPDMSSMMGMFQGMDVFAKASSEYLKIFSKTNDEMQKSIKEFLALMDLVPRKDYLELQEEYEAYKKSVEEKSKSNMGKMLGEEMSLQSQGLRSFEELMRNQTKQFQDLVSNFTTLVSQSQTSSTHTAEEPGEPEAKKAPQVRRKVSPGTTEQKK